MKIYISFFIFIIALIDLEAQSVVDTLVSRATVIENDVDVNTSESDICPIDFFGHMGYTYTQSSEDGETYYNVAYVDRSDIDSIGIVTFGPEINTSNHEGPYCIDAQDSLMYVTRVRTVVHERTGRKQSLRQIVAFDLKSNTPAQLLPFNDNIHHVCHPTLSKDGNTMIYASDYDNNGMDLYVVQRINGVWQRPEALPQTINTRSHEYFPFLHGDDVLFFSSDRGGDMDIYVSRKSVSGWSEPQCLPQPFNSAYDDFGIHVAADGTKGYLTSNRPGGKGSDDIYRWNTKESIFYYPERYQQTISVTVRKKLGFSPIEGADIKLYELNLKDENMVLNLLQGTTGDGELLLKLKPQNLRPEAVAISDSNGMNVLNYHKRKTYLVVVSSRDMKDYSFLLRGEMEEVTALLDPEDRKKTKVVHKKPKAIIPRTKGEIVVYENIYYDYNSSNIRAGAAQELDALAAAMKAQPTMIIQLSAHTDSRGPEDYNQQLSEKRALSAKMYLIKQGVEKERVYSVGYGESRLRNHCKDGVSCSDEEHKYNRRTEVLVIEQ